MATIGVMISKNPSTTEREITFIVREDDGGGYTAHAHWPEGNRDLHTEGDRARRFCGTSARRLMRVSMRARRSPA